MDSKQRKKKINPIFQKKTAYIRILNSFRIIVVIRTVKAIRKIRSPTIVTRRKMRKVIRTLIRMKQVKN